MSSRLLLLPGILAALVACGANDTLATPDPDGYYAYASPEQEPHPAIAEGKPTVEYNGFTFYACPPLAVGEETPLIEESCLTPGDAGASKCGDHSMIEPSIADGHRPQALLPAQVHDLADQRLRGFRGLAAAA